MIRIVRSVFALAVLLLSFGQNPFAQAPAPQPVDSASAVPAASAADAPVIGVRIRNVNWKVDGRSMSFALRDASEIRGNERFDSKAAFEAWVEDRRQVLMNQRVLESVSYEIKYDFAEADGVIPADVLFIVKDTWNIIALPYFKYDSNTGLELFVKARDYNFMGRMQPLKLDLGYTIEPADLGNLDLVKGSLVVEIDSNTPFKAFGYTWNFDFDHYFAYTYQQPFQYWNKSGMSLTLPIGRTDLNFGFYQGFYFNEENGDDYKAEYGERLDGWYMSTWFESTWTIPTGLKNSWGEWNWAPHLVVKNSYLPSGGDIGEERRGPSIELSHKLTFGRVDWVANNFRRGLTVAVNNAFTYNIYDLRWYKSVSAVVAGYAPLLSFVGTSARVSGAIYFDKTNTSAGDPLRGIINNNVHADHYLFVNMDLPIKVISFTPSKWFGKKWMHFFDIEQHWSPFLDVGLVADPDNGRSFSLSEPLIAGGLEVITFSHFMRSLYLRISAGFDLTQAIKDGKASSIGDVELFIGLNHSY